MAALTATSAIGCSATSNAGDFSTGGWTHTGGTKSTAKTSSNFGGSHASGGSSGIGGTSSLANTHVGGVATMGGSASGGTEQTGGASSDLGSGGMPATGGTPSAIGGAPQGGAVNTGGVSHTGGLTSSGGAETTGGVSNSGGAETTGGVSSSGGAETTGGVSNSGGAETTGGSPSTGDTSTGGSIATGGTLATGGTDATGGMPATGGTSCVGSGPIGTISGPLSTGVIFMDTDGNRVNAHGGGIIKVGNTFYMHGEYFLSTTTDNNFHGFSMYSSQDLATWTNEGIILPTQASGLLGPNRKGERPHIIQCPATGEFVLYAHAADVTYQADKEVVFATSPTVNGQYTFQGALTNSSGAMIVHSDMSALTVDNKAYVITESGHLYPLTSDCHNWVSDTYFSTVNGEAGGGESPTVFKAGSTYYWLASYKTGWRANNNFYSTAPAITGPWTYQGNFAPVTDTSKVTQPGYPNPPSVISDQRTWLSQSTWVTPVTGCNGTVYVFWGDHWYGNTDTTAPGKYNYLAGYVFQPFVFNGIQISLPTYLTTWQLDVGLGTWSQQ